MSRRRTWPALSSMPAAATFSSRCSSRDVPGIGATTGERCSNHASATWLTVAPVSPATASSAARSRRGSGNHGMKAIPSRVQYSSTSSCSVSARLYRFCTLTTSISRRACSSCATLTSDRPTCRTLPSCCSRRSAPSWSASGTAGSMRCSCSRSSRSTRSRRRLSSAAWRRYSGRPSGTHSDGDGRAWPILVATSTPSYGCSASASSSSFAPMPYASAVSMSSTPSSTARRATRIGYSRSRAGRKPVSRIAPSPSRRTVRSPIVVVSFMPAPQFESGRSSSNHRRNGQRFSLC